MDLSSRFIAILLLFFILFMGLEVDVWALILSFFIFAFKDWIPFVYKQPYMKLFPFQATLFGQPLKMVCFVCRLWLLKVSKKSHIASFYEFSLHCWISKYLMKYQHNSSYFAKYQIKLESSCLAFPKFLWILSHHTLPELWKNH